MRCVLISLVVGCGLLLGCAGQEVATQTASRPAKQKAPRTERPKRPDYPAERVLIVLDASASMGQQGADAMLQSTQAIMDRLSLKDRFGLAMTSRGQVYLYKTKYESVTNKTVDAALKWAANQPTGGATDLAGAIQAALSLRGENKGRANLILLTDGQNNINLDQWLVKPSQRQGLSIWAATPTLFAHPEIRELCQITKGRVFASACGTHVGSIVGMRSRIESLRKFPKESDGWYPSRKSRRAYVRRGTLAEEARRRKRVEERLYQRLTVRLIEQEFPAVMEYLREVSGVNIRANWGALENDNPDIRTAQVTVQLKNVTVQEALEAILDDAGGGLMELDYEIEGGVLHVNTLTRLNARVVTRVYPVGDLLYKESGLPIYMVDIREGCFCGGYSVTLRFARTWSDESGCLANPILGGKRDRPLSIQLLNLIEQHVADNSWYPNGMARIALFDSSLVVSQTPFNHREIRALLDRIRYARDLATAQGPFRSVESIYTPDGQLALWTKQLLQAVADGTLSPHSTVVRSTRNGVTTVKIDGVDLVVPAKGKSNPKGKTK